MAASEPILSPDEFRRRYSPAMPAPPQSGTNALNSMFAKPPPALPEAPTVILPSPLPPRKTPAAIPQPVPLSSALQRAVKLDKEELERPRKERKDGRKDGAYKFPAKPKIRPKRDQTARKRAQQFFEDNIMDFAIVMWEVATDIAAKPSERYGAAKAAIEFGRGKAGQEEQIKNEKPQLNLHQVGGGALKESLLGAHRVDGELPALARNRLLDVESRLLDDVIPPEEDNYGETDDEEERDE